MVGDEHVIWGAVIGSSKVSIVYMSKYIINPFLTVHVNVLEEAAVVLWRWPVLGTGS